MQPTKRATERLNIIGADIIGAFTKGPDNCPRCAITRGVLKELLRVNSRRRAYHCRTCGGLGHSRQTCPNP